MTTVSVIVTVDGLADLDTVKADCEQVGLTSVRALPKVHLLTGTIVETALGELAAVTGVRAVERERQVSLRPPRRAGA